MLEDVIQWRKFEKVKHIAQTLLDPDSIDLKEIAHVLETLINSGTQDELQNNVKSEHAYVYQTCRELINSSAYMEHGIKVMQKGGVSRSHKFLMLKPLVLKMFSRLGEYVFENCEDVMQGAKLILQEEPPDSFDGKESFTEKYYITSYFLKFFKTTIFHRLNLTGSDRYR